MIVPIARDRASRIFFNIFQGAKVAELRMRGNWLLKRRRVKPKANLFPFGENPELSANVYPLTAL